MCLTAFAYKVHPDFPLILLNNRDEFHARPAAPLQVWDSDPLIFAGQDLQAGGTWLAISENGRFANITNYRDFRLLQNPDAPSRGELITDFLSIEKEEDFYNKILANGKTYNPFSFLAGSVEELFFYSNTIGTWENISPGISGLSNHLLNSPWPKVQRAKYLLSEIIAEKNPSRDLLLDILSDTTPGLEENLPDTGRDIAFEKKVSSIFIHDEIYGTRASTLVMVDKHGNILVKERSWNPQGKLVNVETVEFASD